MSETWTQDCQECGGSGNKHDKECKWLKNKLLGCTCYFFTRMPIKKEPCPPCSGSGGFNLVVAVPSKHKGDTGYYRPLTVEEVDELERYEYHLWKVHHGNEIGGKWDSYYWGKVDNGDMYYKGSKVTLQPREVK